MSASQKGTLITAAPPLYRRGKELVWANPKFENIIFHMESAELIDLWTEAGACADRGKRLVITNMKQQQIDLWTEASVYPIKVSGQEESNSQTLRWTTCPTSPCMEPIHCLGYALTRI